MHRSHKVVPGQPSIILAFSMNLTPKAVVFSFLFFSHELTVDPQTDIDCALAPGMPCLSTSHGTLVGKQVKWVSRRVKTVGCQACQEWVHERKTDRFATLSQRSMTGVMFAGMKEDKEP